MQIIYQGKAVETKATTLGEFITERALNTAAAIVEYAGEVYAPGTDLGGIALKPDAAIDVFKLTAGG